MTTRLRWGILGAARIAAQRVVPAMQAASDNDVHAVSSASGKARAFAQRFGLARAYTSHDELLADPQIDAVYVPLPNALHRPWVVRAAQAGKHVLCEKPIALSVEELDEIDEAARTSGVQVAEAFMYRHHPQIATLRRLVDDRAVGELVAVEACFHFRLDRSAGHNIRLDPTLGGGALRDVGCYPIDLMNLLLGRPPEQVTALATRQEGDPVDSTIGGVSRFGEVLGIWSAGFMSPLRQWCRVTGRDGSIEVPQAFRPDRDGGTGTLIVTTGHGTRTIEERGDPFRLEVEDFARLVRERDRDEYGARLSRWTVATTQRVAGIIAHPRAGPFDMIVSSGE
jgi:D-xylose 1-dehydrogenase (NADP+, D-xylono-1,5-lactone-forming)